MGAGDGFWSSSVVGHMVPIFADIITVDEY